MLPEKLTRVLASTGFLIDGSAAPRVKLGDEARQLRRRGAFAPDALWRSDSNLTVYFKFQGERPEDSLIASWRKEIWNEGIAPLLWLVTPDRIDLFNGFGRPQKDRDVEKYLLQTFQAVDASLRELNARAGRIAMESGQFWASMSKDLARTRVDHQLLEDLGRLESHLVDDDLEGLERAEAQALIGRTIFAQYLIDREIVSAKKLHSMTGYRRLAEVLRDRSATGVLFKWLRETFNGDMFPEASAVLPKATALKRIGSFLDGEDEKGQGNLFPYQFDVIPVELISSIYERFAHSAKTRAPQRPAAEMGVYYTRMPVVSLVLDEVMDEISGHESVLDLTCGSGVFLVEAFRRLVHSRKRDGEVDRKTIRSVLYDQIRGVDISQSAIRVAAFSLYLAALEFDPDPRPAEALKFEPLIGRTLLVGNAHSTSVSLPAGKPFDIIVGNPPWTFKGKKGTAERRRHLKSGVSQAPRGESLDFLRRALDFADGRTRFGMVLSGVPFFAASKTSRQAVQDLVARLMPVTLVNLAAFRSWLFPGAQMPAMVLLARHRPGTADRLTVVQVPWSDSAEKTRTFEISPDDVRYLRFQDWVDDPTRLKVTATARRRDMTLYNRMQESLRPLSARCGDEGVSRGLILGNRRGDTEELRKLVKAKLPFLTKERMARWRLPPKLPVFEEPGAERTRKLETWSAPLIVVKEILPDDGRPMAAASDQSLVYTDSFLGIQVSSMDLAWAITAILNSAFASWFFLVSGAELGVYKRRLLKDDVKRLPVPEFERLEGPEGARLRAMAIAPDIDLKQLDDAVFDLYGVNAWERVLVRDALSRTRWEWEEERDASAFPASQVTMEGYASRVLEVMNGVFSGRSARLMRAEILEPETPWPIRIAHFSLVERALGATVEVRRVGQDLDVTVADLSKAMKFPLGSALVGQRELRVHSNDDVLIIKPAASRFWMQGAALDDADALLADAMTGGTAA